MNKTVKCLIIIFTTLSLTAKYEYSAQYIYIYIYIFVKSKFAGMCEQSPCLVLFFQAK